MAAHDRYTDTSAAYSHFRQMHDFTSFVLKLHLFRRISFECFRSDLWNHIASYLILESINVDWTAAAKRVYLILQFNGTGCSRSAYCLIGRRYNALDLAGFPQPVYRNQ